MDCAKRLLSISPGVLISWVVSRVLSTHIEVISGKVISIVFGPDTAGY